MTDLKVIWSKFASNQLENILFFITLESNKKVALKVIKEILHACENLSLFPYAGKIEPLLLELNSSYRYIIKGNYKIIYNLDIDYKQVRIIDVFDSRQNPENQFRSIKK